MADTAAVVDTTASESQSSLDKVPVEVKPSAKAVDLDRLGETKGYVLDEANLKRELGLADDAKLKLAPDGHTVLIPQPTDDPEDPLNWPAWRKTMVLTAICIASVTGDYGSATGATSIVAQATQWHLSPNTINHATAGGVFMLGAGGIITVWLSSYFGRLPVLVVFEAFAFGMSAWCAAATSFESFMAARILQGFFSSAAAAGGLMFIKDIYYFHDHPRKINIWAAALILSPFLGPLIMAGILTSTSWRWGFWVLTIISGIGLILTVVFVDETFYPRKVPEELRPARKSRVLRIIGVEQVRTKYIGNTFWEASKRPVVTICKLPVFLATTYYFFTFAWVIAINITASVFILPLYHWGYKQLCLIYLAPCIGCILGLTGGHWLHDLVGRMYMSRHNGRIEPEARLILVWVFTPLVIVGMVMIGASLQHGYHYMVLAVGWAMHNCSIIVVTTAINAYALDSYPEASGEVAAWLNAGRTIGGFIVGYVQIPWAEKTGPQTELGIQAAIVAAAFGIIIFLQFYGARLRHWQGPCEFKTQ